MGSGQSTPTPEDVIKRAKALTESNPGNRAAKYLNELGEEYLTGLGDRYETFLKCVCTGLENPDSGLGCYAQTPSDYDEFGTFFDKVIGDYHKDDPAFDAKTNPHQTDWDISKSGEDGVIDLRKSGLTEELSMRVRVGRNLKGFNLPGSMDKAERIKFEVTMCTVFKSLIEDPKFGGNIYSMSPDLGEGVENPNKITDEKYDELVKAHVMFKDMAADPYLASAGIASDWPYGRGCWQSSDKKSIIWFGEEDQLRIMCMGKGFLLNEIFSGLSDLLQAVEKIDGVDFATSEKYGYVTSCPSNLGTGMRASVHVKLPNLTSDGTDAKVKVHAKPLKLSVRGTGGEHTPIGADGTVDISPSNRLFIKECEIVEKLAKGLTLLLEKEAEAGAETATEAPKEAEAPKEPEAAKEAEAPKEPEAAAPAAAAPAAEGEQ